MAIKSSQELKSFIKKKEKFEANPYIDKFSGKLTVGYGDTEGSMQPISEPEAYRRMEDRLALAEASLSNVITRSNLNQYQQDALVDMEYNIGLTKLKKSGFIDLVNNGTDDQIVESIKKYTKAKNPKTGLYEDVPGLIDRANERANMWRKGLTPQGQVEQITDMFADLSNFKPAGSDALSDLDKFQPKNQDIFSDVGAYKPKSAVVDPVAARSQDLKITGEALDETEVQSNKQAKKLAKEIDIPFDEAQALIFEKNPNQIKIEKDQDIIAKHFPVTAEWAKSMDNYALLRDSTNNVAKLEVTAKSMNNGYLGTLADQFKSGAYQYKENYALIARVLGGISDRELGQILTEVENERSKITMGDYEKGAESISKSFSKVSKSFAKTGEAFTKFKGSLDDKVEVFEKSLYELFDGTAESASSVLSSIITAASNPAALSLMGASSSASFVTSTTGAVAGGAAGFFAGSLPGAAVGAKAGAGVATAIDSFGAYLREQLEDFRDPITGKIMVENAFSDPIRVRKWVREASKYGIAMGAIDAIITGKAGSAVVKPVKPGSFLKKAVSKTGQLAKGTAVQAVGEGAQEFGARIAAKAGEKDFTAQTVAEAASQAVEEAIVSAGPGAAMEVGGAAARTVVPPVLSKMEALVKTKDKVEKSNKANASYNTVQEIRKILEEDPNLADNPEAIADLINRTVTPQKDLQGEKEITTLQDENFDSDVEAETKNLIEENESGFVSVYPSDWNVYAAESGMDPVDAIQKMGPEIAQQYASNKESDSPIVMPIGEWIIKTKDLDDADAIAYFNDNEYNAVEGLKTSEQFERDPFTLLSQAQDPNEPPPLPGQEAPETVSVSDIPQNDEEQITDRTYNEPAILRPIELYDRFQNDFERKVYSDLLKGFKKSLSSAKSVTPEMVEAAAFLHFRHFRGRARMLGTDIRELAKRLSFERKEGPGYSGQFSVEDSTWYLGSPYKLVFNKYTNIASIYHELGHNWLHDMSEDWHFINAIPEDKLTSEQKEYKDVMAITAEFFNLENIGQLYNLGNERFSEIHEKWAQTTEKYFLEGTFGDSRIKKVLESLRKWMVKIAQNVARGYPHWPPLKIDPKVERVFNVLMDADSKIEEQAFPMFHEPMFANEFLGKDQDKYIELVQNARSEAIADIYAQMYKVPLKEREQLINKALDEFTKEAEEEVSNLPSMRLLRDMTDYYKQYKDKKLESDPRISYNSFKELLANNSDSEAAALREMIPKEMVSTKGKGGVDIRIIMQQMDIIDPNEMKSILLQSAKKEELIADRVDSLIDQRFPPLKSDREIHDAAVQALNKRGKEDVITREFNILMDRYRSGLKVLIERGMLPASLLGSRNAKAVIKHKAMQKLLDTPIGDFKYKRFLKTSDKHGRASAEAFKKGNVLYAFEEKYKQAIDFFAFKEAINATREVAKTNVLLKNFKKIAQSPEKAKTYDIDLMTFGVQIIGFFENKSAVIPFLDISKFSDRSGISEDDVVLINKQIDVFNRTNNGRTGPNTSVSSYLHFGSILSMIAKMARDAKVIEIAGETVLREEYIGRLVKEVGPRLNRDAPISSREAVLQVLYGLRPVRSELASLFKDDVEFEKSILGKLYRQVTLAEAERNEKLDVQREKIVKALKETVKGDSFLTEFIKPFTSIYGSYVLNAPAKPVSLKNLGITLDNKAELYMMLLYAGSESGLEKLMMGGIKGKGSIGTYNPDTGLIDDTKLMDDIQDLVDQNILTKKDFDLLQTIWDSFESFYPDLKKSIRATEGRNLGYVKPRTLKTPFGDYRGGYIPISSEEYLKQKALESMNSADHAMYKTSDLFPDMDLSVTKTRSGNFYDVNLDFSRITAKLAGTANIAYMRKPLLNVGKILGSPVVQKAIENRRPGFYDASLIPWFDRVKLQQFSEPSREFHNKFAKMLRLNANIKNYFLNVKAGIKQFIGVSNAVPLVGAVNLSNAARKFMLSPKKSIEFISEMDPVMKQVFESHHINQIKSFENLELNFNWANMTQEKASQMAFFLIQSCQTATSSVVWLAGYQRALDKGLSGDTAISFATNAVKNSQGSTTVSDMAKVQFGTDAYKLLTQFSLVPVTAGAELYKSYMRTGDAQNRLTRESLRFAAVMASAVFTIAVPGIMEALVSEMGADEPEEKDKEKMEKIKRERLAQDMMFNFADSAVPVYGRWFAKPLIYGQVSISPLLDSVGRDFMTAKKGVQASSEGAEFTAREMQAMMNLVTYGTGLPFTIVGKTAKIEEESKPKSEKIREAKKRKAVLKKAKKREQREK